MPARTRNARSLAAAQVDLFSLGVVVFEMFHPPFRTAMERHKTLTDLRSGEMPKPFERAQPQVARLIQWLMSPNPSDRPTANMVLQSDLLPRRVRDEQVSDLLRSLPDDPAAYAKVLRGVIDMGMFRPEAAGGPAAGSMLVDELPGIPKLSGSADPQLRDQVVSTLKAILALHGAVPMASSSLGYATPDMPEASQRVTASWAPCAWAAVAPAATRTC